MCPLCALSLLFFVYADRPDAEVAKEAWEGYEKRSSSAIADFFAGQFRSHVQCNKCGHSSLTFDPYLSIRCVRALIVPHIYRIERHYHSSLVRRY